MYTKWTSHISDLEEKIRFQAQINSAKPVLERLLQLLQENEEVLDKIDISAKQFDSPNWAYRQAFNNGGRAAFVAIKKLVDLDQQETNYDRKFTDPTPIYVRAEAGRE